MSVRRWVYHTRTTARARLFISIIIDMKIMMVIDWI